MKDSSRKGKPNKYQNVHGMMDIYDMYISDKELDSPYHISRGLFRDIIYEYNEYVTKEILNGSIFFMPHGLGSLYVIRKKFKPAIARLAPNWELSLKYNKIIYHLNEHSNGYRYNFKWDKKACRFRNYSMYRLTMIRGIKRLLAKYIKQLGFDYIEE